jgi:branched-chain amino acid transport system substrate-binding protein
MKKKTVAAVLGVSILWLPAARASGDVPGVAKDLVTIGAIVDKSGPVVYPMTHATYGQLSYFQKAHEERLYHRRVQLMTEDGGYDPAKHPGAGKLLLDRDNVFCFVNSVGTSPTLALNGLLEERKVPLVSGFFQARAIAVPLKRYIFNQMGSYFDQARVCVDFVLGKAKGAKIAMICQDDDMGSEGQEGLLAQLEKHGAKPVGAVTFQRGTKDFSASVLKLRSLNPDYVINHSIPAYGAQIMKEAHKLGWKPHWIMMSGNVGPDIIKLAGESFDFAGEVYGVGINYPPDGDTPGALEFREALKRYQPAGETNLYAFWGYGFARVALEGLKRAEASGRLTREGLIEALETLSAFETGVFPPITYTSTSHAAPDMCLIVQRVGPRWVPVSNEWLKPK